MADWTTVASLATAGGTLILAVATFGSRCPLTGPTAERTSTVGRWLSVFPALRRRSCGRISTGHRWVAAGPRSSAMRARLLATSIRNAGRGLAVLRAGISSRVHRDRLPARVDEFQMQHAISTSRPTTSASAGALRPRRSRLARPKPSPSESRFRFGRCTRITTVGSGRSPLRADGGG